MKFPHLACGLLSVATGLFAQEPEAAANAKSLANAENAFAQESVEKGMRTAFLHALSDKGLVFEPDPRNGKEVWQARKESDAQLQWQPVLAVVAASGDLGYTTGPWSFKEKASDQEASAFGQFVSIWRRESGQWKLFFDLGSENPKPIGSTPSLQLIDLKARNDSSPASARDAMLQRDREYGTAPLKNFSANAAEDVRVIRPGEFPAIGKTAAETVLKKAEQPEKFADAKGEVSKAGDLGVAWGEYSSSKSGYYLRIWRKSDAGEWKLALDLLHPR